jgi:putative oxidoreductase
LLIRVLVGWVFLSEGIQKFLFQDSLGVGRFVKIGIPWPQVMAPFVGIVEIACGALLLIGLLTRLAAVPLLIDIWIALYSTKIVTLAKNGFWSTLHEARTDVSMLLGLIFLLLVGGGSLALDVRLLQEGMKAMPEQIRSDSSESASPTRNVSIGELAFFFLRLGTTAFGGPAAHIAIMEDELVRRRPSNQASEI